MAKKKNVHSERKEALNVEHGRKGCDLPRQHIEIRMSHRRHPAHNGAASNVYICTVYSVQHHFDMKTEFTLKRGSIRCCTKHSTFNFVSI